MNIEKPTFKHLCFMHMQQLTNFPYIEKDFDALTDYGLLCKVVDYLNQIIANSNEQNTAILNLYDAFIELKDYVDTYFDENFPQLVNDKLDEMASDGTLENLINNRVKLITLYNTMAEVKESNNLVKNLTIKTLGYYEVNDGGGAYYKITDEESETEYQEELDHGLYATLIIENEVNVKQLGAYGDNTHDDTNIFKTAIEKFDNIFIPNASYLISDKLTISTTKFISGEDIKNTILNFNIITENENAIEVTGLTHSWNYSQFKNISIINISENTTLTGIYTNYVVNTEFLNSVLIKNFKNNCYMTNAWNINIINCYMQYADAYNLYYGGNSARIIGGYYLNGDINILISGKNCYIHGVDISYPKTNGIYGYYANGLSIDNLYSEHADNYKGIMIKIHASKCVSITNTQFEIGENNSTEEDIYGIYVTNSYNVTINTCYFNGYATNPIHSIAIYGSQAPNFNIKNCLFEKIYKCISVYLVSELYVENLGYTEPITYLIDLSDYDSSRLSGVISANAFRRNKIHLQSYIQLQNIQLKNVAFIISDTTLPIGFIRGQQCYSVSSQKLYIVQVPATFNNDGTIINDATWREISTSVIE